MPGVVSEGESRAWRSRPPRSGAPRRGLSRRRGGHKRLGRDDGRTFRHGLRDAQPHRRGSARGRPPVARAGPGQLLEHLLVRSRRDRGLSPAPPGPECGGVRGPGGLRARRAPALRLPARRRGLRCVGGRGDPLRRAVPGGRLHLPGTAAVALTQTTSPSSGRRESPYTRTSHSGLQ
jgi:hypothetical protein